MKLIVTLCFALLLTAVSGVSARSPRGSRNHQPAAQSAEPKVIDIAAIARAQATGADQGSLRTANIRPEPSLFRRVILPSGAAAIVCLLTTGAVLYFLRRRNLLRIPTGESQQSAVPLPAIPAEPAAVVALPVVEPAPVRMRQVSRFSQIDEPVSDGPVDLVKVAKMLGVGIGELKLAVHLRTVGSGRQMNEAAA
jgi:hypothetical protein